MEKPILTKLLFFCFSFLIFSTGLVHGQSCVTGSGVESTNETCPGAKDGTATIEITGGTPNFVFELQRRVGIASYANVRFSEEVSARSYTFTGLAPDSYRIVIYDSNLGDCVGINSDGFIIKTTGTTPADISISGASSVCEGETGITYSVPLTTGSTYTWSVPAGATIVSGATGPDNNSIVVDFGSASGNVSVVETNSGSCSGKQSSLAVNVQPKPEIYNLSANGATSFCQGEAGPELLLSGSQSGTSYSLIRDGSTSVATVAGTGSSISFGNQNLAGSYTVMAAVDAMSSCQEDMNGEVVLNPLEKPTISASDLQQISCFGGSDGAIDITIFNGLAPYSYVWNNGETTEDISGLNAGTYSVTVTDANGCTVAQSFTLTEPTALDLNASITPVNCKGDSNGAISLEVSGGTTDYTYLWSTGATTKDISGLAAGDYKITVTDANSCTITESFTVPEGAEILLSATVTDVKCNEGTDGAIDLLVNGGTAPYSYAWSIGQTSEDLNNVAAGNYSVTVTDSKGCSATGSYTITEPTPLALSLSGTDATTCEGSDGNIDLSVSGGTGIYTYAWGNGATTEDLSGLSAGTYTVNVSDENKCVATAAFTIGEPAGITSLSAEATAVSCFGGSNGAIALTVNGGTAPYTYSWNNGATTEDISGLTAGTYSVTVTDDKNCKATLEVAVTEPADLQLTGNATDISCAEGNDGKIDLTVSGGTAPYTYAWSSGHATASISGLSAGSYTVEVADENGCKKSATYTINEPAALGLSVSLTNASTCGGAEGSIDITVSGGTAAYTYAWNNGATTEDISGLTAGIYSVTVTDGNSCTLEESFVIEQPAGISSLTAVTKDALCFEGNEGEINLTVNGGVAPYTYAWNNGATTEDISGLTAGTYTVSVVDENKCELSASFTIGQPAAISLTLTPTNVTRCGGNNGSIDLSVSGGTAAYTYAWENGRTTEDINGLSAGTYSVTVTDANGCTATGSATISEPSGISSLRASVTAVKCFDGTDGAVNLTVEGGVAPYTYAWNNGATTEDISGLTAGTYSVMVTDANGCSASQTFAVSEPAAALKLGSSDITAVNCAGENTGAIDISISGGTAPYSFAWTNGATTEDILELAAGTYSVMVTDTNGCTLNESFTVPAGVEITLSANVQDVSCNGDSNGSINLGVEGGTAPYTYAWNNGATTEDISNLTAGDYTVTVTDVNNCSASATFAVAGPAILSLTLNPTHVSSCGGNDGAVNLTVSGGTAAYTYAWSNGGTTEGISGLAAGTYTVVVTDANGCEANGSVSISEPAGITSLTADLQHIDCKDGNNGAINLTVEGGSGSITFLWNNGATTEDISGLTAGTYSVTVTDANGCSANGSFSITEPENGLSLTYEVTNPKCFGEGTGDIDITVSGGTAPYTYAWDDKAGSTTEDLANLAAGTYTVIVTDSKGCSVSQSVEVVSPAAVEATLNATNVSTCGAADGSVDLEVSGGTAPYTYLWNNGATTQDISNLAAGTYSVVISDVNSCELTQSVAITAPEGITEVNIVVVNEISCADGTDGSLLAEASGGTAPYTYVWSNGVTTASNRNLGAGTYEVTVTDANSCSQTARITLAEPQPIAFQADLTAPTCEGLSNGAIDVTVSGGTAPYTYSWNNGIITEDLTNIPEGTYELTVTDASSCSQTISYTLDAPTVLELSLTQQNATSCSSNEGSIDLSVSGGSGTYTYLWSNGATSQDLNNLSADTYTVIVTDANGCSATASTTITAPAGISGLTADVQDAGCGVNNNGSIDLTVTGGTAPFTYSWNNGATSEDLNGLETGTYEVTVTDANGCTALAAFAVGGGGDFVVDAGIKHVTCSGGANGAIALGDITGGTAPYTYQWSTGATSTMIEGLSIGTYELTVTDANTCSALYIYSITEPAPIQIAHTQENVICAGGEEGSITLSVTGGTGSYSYAWADGATSANRTALAAGTYEVTVTDENTCTATASFTITEPDPITIFVKAAKNESCPGANDGRIDINTLGGSGGYTFLWSNGVTTDRIENLTPGTYSVVVTDGKGCTAEATFEVLPAVPLLLEAAITNISCSTKNTGAIDLSVSGGAAPYTYSWSNGATTEDIANLSAGDFTVTVTDNNQCQQQATYTIGSAESIALSAVVTDVVCAGDANGAIDLSVTGGQAPYSFAWDNGAPSEDLRELTAGTYTVLVTDASACSASASFVVNTLDNVVVDFPDEIMACVPDSVKLFTNYRAIDGYEVKWELESQLVFADTIYVKETQNVKAIVTNLETGCSAGDMTFVYLVKGKITSSVEINKNVQESCGNEAVQLEATVSNIGQDPGYEWYRNGIRLEGETSAILNLTEYAESDSISVLVDVDLECVTNNPVSNYIKLSVPAIEAPTVSASSATVCEGKANPVLTAADYLEGSTLRWYLGSVAEENLLPENTASYTPTVTDAGTYTYYVTQTTERCGTSEAASISFTISNGAECEPVEPPVCETTPVVDLGIDQFRCEPATVTLNSGYTPEDGYIIEWRRFVSVDETEVIGGNTATLDVSESGRYIAKVTEVAVACMNADTVTVLIESNVSNISASINVLDEITCEMVPIRLEAGLLVDGEPFSFGNAVTYTWFEDEELLPSTSSKLVLDAYHHGDVYKVVIAHNQTCATPEQTATVEAEFKIELPALAAPELARSAETVCEGSENPIFSVVNLSEWSYFKYIRWYKGSVAEENLVATGTTDYRPTVTTPGEHTFLVTQEGYRCMVSEPASISFTISNDPSCESVEPPVCENSLVVDLGENQFRCEPAEVELNAGYNPEEGYLIEWTKTTEAGTVATGGNTGTITVSESGTYAAKVTHVATGCVGMDLVEVEILGSVSGISVALATEGTADCAGAPVTFAANLYIEGEGYEFGTSPVYSFTRNEVIAYEGTENMLVLENYADGDVITVNVQLNLSCASAEQTAAVTASHTIELAELPAPVLSTSSATVCEGDENPILSVTEFVEGSVLRWYQESIAPENLVAEKTKFYRPTVTAAGEYTYYVTQITANCGTSEAGSISFIISNDPGCESVEPPVCENSLVVDLGENQFRCEPAEVELNAGYNSEEGYLIEWTKTTESGTVALDGNTRTIRVNESATYAAKVTYVATGCVGMDLVEVEIAESVSGISVALDTEGTPDCAGTPVTFAANMSIEGEGYEFGTSPVYSFTRNEVIAYEGTENMLVLENYADGDVITVSVQLNLSCASAEQTATVTASHTIELDAPAAPALAISKNTICVEETNPEITVTSYISGSVLKWYKGTVAEENLIAVPENTTSYTPDVTEAGEYTYVVTQTTEACGTSEGRSISFTISDDPDCTPAECDINPVVGIMVEPGTTICEDITKVQLRASGVNVGSNATYTWFFNETQIGTGTVYEYATTDGFTSGDVFQLKVKINDPAFICNGVDEITEEVSLTVEGSVTPELTIVGPKPVCLSAGGTLQFEARGKYIDWRFHGLASEFSWFVNEETEPRKRALLSDPEDNSPMRFELSVAEVTANTRVRVEVKQPESLGCVPDPNPVVTTVPVAEEVMPTVSMSTPASGICPNTATTFNASSSYSGDNPVYVWYVKSVGGAEMEVQRGTTASFRYATPLAGEQIRVKVEVANRGDLCLTATEAMSGAYTVVLKTEEECAAGGGFNCGAFAAVLKELREPSCGQSNGYLKYEISGGFSPYWVEYSFAGTDLKQSLQGDIITVEIEKIPANELISISIRDASGKECSFDDKLKPAAQLTATFTKAEDGDVSCFGEKMGKAVLSVTGGNAPYQYRFSDEDTWYQMGSRKEFSNLPAGITSVFVRQSENDQCFAEAEVEIFNRNPKLDFTFVSKPANCNDNVGEISITSITGGTGNSFQVKLKTKDQNNFIDFNGTATFGGLKRGDYAVVVTDGVCEFEKLVTVGSPGEIAIMEPRILEYDCENPAAKAGLHIQINQELTNIEGPYEATVYYKRFVQDEFKALEGLNLQPFTQEFRVYGLEKGIYTIDVRSVSREGCPENYQKEIEINNPDMPTPVTFAHRMQHIFCNGEEGSISITEMYGDPLYPFKITISREGVVVKDSVISLDRYARYSAEGPYTIRDLSSGIYRLTISQDQQGCNGQIIAKDAVFEIEEKAVKLTAEVVSKTESFPEKGSGSLTFSVRTNSGEAPYVSSIYLVESLFPGQYYESEGDTVEYNSIEATFGLTYKDMPAGIYEIYIVDANGCSVMLTDTIGHDTNIFIPNVITPNGDGVNENFYVRNIPDTGTRLVVTNRWGKVVYITEDYRNNWNGGTEPDGIYFYHLLVTGTNGLELKGWLEIRRGAKP